MNQQNIWQKLSRVIRRATGSSSQPSRFSQVSYQIFPYKKSPGMKQRETKMNIWVATANRSRGRRKKMGVGVETWERDHWMSGGAGVTEFSTLLKTRQLFVDSSMWLERSHLVGGCVSCLTTLLNSNVCFGFSWSQFGWLLGRCDSPWPRELFSHCIIMHIYCTQEVNVDENVFFFFHLLENEWLLVWCCPQTLDQVFNNRKMWSFECLLLNIFCIIS